MKRIAVIFGAVAMCAACDQPAADQCGTFSDGTGMVEPSMGFGPTSVYCGPVTTLDNRPGTVGGGNATGGSGGSGSGGGGEGGSGGSGGSTLPTPAGNVPSTTMGDPNIVVYGTVNGVDTVWQIGPGRTFGRIGGEATTVWCKPQSDCQGSNRSPIINSPTPEEGWTLNGYAFFRRAGSVGDSVSFVVDGNGLSLSF